MTSFFPLLLVALAASLALYVRAVTPEEAAAAGVLVLNDDNFGILVYFNANIPFYFACISSSSSSFVPFR